MVASRYYWQVDFDSLSCRMTSDPRQHTLDLLDRLIRLAHAEDWTGELNPAQQVALTYLRRANRFSRAPSHVADYLATTRGTASQTLKALARKGLVEELPSPTDRRSISYRVTDAGSAALHQETGVPPLQQAIHALPEEQREGLDQGLEALLRHMLRLRGGRSFGLCHTCRHHQAGPDGATCTLLQVPLEPAETGLICHEHAARA